MNKYDREEVWDWYDASIEEWKLWEKKQKTIKMLRELSEESDDNNLAPIV